MDKLLDALRRPLWIAAFISIAVNLLMLISPIFMPQVFDRVLSSAHVETLFGLFAIAIFSLVFMAIFDSARQVIMMRVTSWMETQAGEAAIGEALANQNNPARLFQAIGQVKSFLGNSGLFALLDAPWVLIFTAVLWWMHPYLGMFAVASAILLLCLTVVMEIINRGPLQRASMHQSDAQDVLDGVLRNADAITAMGMGHVLKARWRKEIGASIDHKGKAGARSAILSG